MYNNTLFSIGLATLELKGMDNDMLCNYVKENIGRQNRHVNSDDAELSKLNAIVLQQTQKILDGTISNPDVNNLETQIKRVWVNQDLNTDISTTHTHRDSFLSVIYYPKSTDGKIHFYIPSADVYLSHVPIYKCKEYNEYNSTFWEFDVKTGYLLIFNSMLPHAALPSKEERVSIVYDIVVNENN
jgi:uncharacterized protein (TIGR02466 family)|tara:strand:+ start:254 stop:808 length:555 start_codon:yes stop_codon:yes gene_type:complete